jgi:DNA (cytosine-5)-methyltransferase 1
MKNDIVKKVKVIDLFAGPGGLGEGFSRCNNSRFEIAVSVEKEKNAHSTLTLRAFYRKLKDKSLYVKYVSSKSKASKDLVMQEICKTKEWEQALYETMGAPHAIGNSGIFEKWQKGEVPSPEDFKEKTKEQVTIDKRIGDICKATGRDKAKKLKNCDPLIVIGGPPCQAYSTMGRGRRAGIKDHNQDHDQRFFLYKEYADVIEMSRPDIFVMENVAGIGSAKLANGARIFPEIIKRLEYLKENPKPNDKKKYHIYSLTKDKCDFVGTELNPNEKDFLVNAKDFGVPQDRRRVILLGINTEHDSDQFVGMIMNPINYPESPSVAETIKSLLSIRSSISNRSSYSYQNKLSGKSIEDTDDNWEDIRKQSMKIIHQLVSGSNALIRGVDEIISWEKTSAKLEKEKNIKAVERVAGDSLGEVSLTEEECSKIAGKIAEYKNTIKYVYEKIESRLDSMGARKTPKKGSDFFLSHTPKKVISSKNLEKYSDLEFWLSKDFPGTLNHCAKQHMPDDMTRYMFSALWTDAQRKTPPPLVETSPSPTTKYFPKVLASDHKSWFSKNFQDRFRTYPSNYRAKTITSHMQKDGHANIHYDPMQMRSLTVREAARLQTFPDDYYFEGGQSAQYLQVGNAVPPFLAKHIGEHVLAIMKIKKII